MTNTDWDDLEDPAFAAPRSTTDLAAAQRQINAVVTKTAEGRNYRTGDRSQERGNLFYENCEKCRGTGRFVSWAGRDVGPCHTCKGQGKLGYKVPREQRLQAAERRADAKQKAHDAALQCFDLEHPDVRKWMDEGIASGFEFAISLAAAVEKYGSLTENQLAAAYRMIVKKAEAKAAAIARAETAQTVDVSRMEAAFAAARKNRVKRLLLEIGGLKFNPAKKDPAILYVKKDDGTYLGKITGGKLFCVSACSKDQEAEILKIASDPAAAADVHGLATNICSCCGAELTNKDSVRLGIGPVCRSKWGW